MTDDANGPAPQRPPTADPQWYRDAILYEVHVRAFADGNADGIGDFKGLTARLDYLRDLGITALWLLPFYPSPMRDDGYDISDYVSVHPAYGSLRDVARLVREAHARGIRVITELVCNHTSDQHPWFQRARRAPPGSVWRNFYVWSDTPERYKDARIIFQDFETSNWTWDPVARAYYWHRFYSQQPDLNFDSPRVRQELFRVVDFWLSLGIDGLRLDAVPYLYEREGTSCENLPETHAFLKALRAHIDERFDDRMLLAEANQWPETAATYFGDGDECHMAFHFPLMPRMFMALRMEDRFPIVDILSQTPAIPPTSQWTLFLRNHDELTLEMVTDEERDYMYRAYAQDPQARVNLGIRRRLAPLLGNHRRRIELLYGLLLSLPGTPALYYGDEIGMGDNIYLGDRNSVRTPMQWSADVNAGFSAANRQRLYLPVIEDPEYHYQAVNVATQEANPHSLLAWLRRLIVLRKRHRAFGRGAFEMLHPENRRVLAYMRILDDERILVVANLSRFVQHTYLDLSAYRGMRPVEAFGESEFPVIDGAPYPIVLGPHAFYWFTLEAPHDALGAERRAAPAPLVAVPPRWAAILAPGHRQTLAEAIAAYVADRRWFAGHGRRVAQARVVDVVRPASQAASSAHILLLEFAYREGDPERYLVPVSLADGQEADAVLARAPDAVVARLGDGGLLYDALQDPAFAKELLQTLAHRRHLHGEQGLVVGMPTGTTRRLADHALFATEPALARVEQSNSSVVFRDLSVLKVLRRLEDGPHPEAEVGRLLTENGRYGHSAPFEGALEYRVGERAATVAILFGYVPNEGDAWQVYQRELADLYAAVLARPPEPALDLGTGLLPWQLVGTEPPPALASRAMPGLERARLLGRRTAELHAAFVRPPLPSSFVPQPFTPLYQRALGQSIRNLIAATLRDVEQRRQSMDSPGKAAVDAFVATVPRLGARVEAALAAPLRGRRQRTHGDFHLGQVLVSAGDLVMIDFEGEPNRPLAERRNLASPLRDVAGMLRSFQYAAWAPVLGRPTEEEVDLRPWAEAWARFVGAAFLGSYLEAAQGLGNLLSERDSVEALLEVHLLEKALYEVRYELASRPGWVRIPLAGLLALIGEDLPPSV